MSNEYQSDIGPHQEKIAEKIEAYNNESNTSRDIRTLIEGILKNEFFDTIVDHITNNTYGNPVVISDSEKENLRTSHTMFINKLLRDIETGTGGLVQIPDNKNKSYRVQDKIIDTFVAMIGGKDTQLGKLYIVLNNNASTTTCLKELFKSFLRMYKMNNPKNNINIQRGYDVKQGQQGQQKNGNQSQGKSQQGNSQQGNSQQGKPPKQNPTTGEGTKVLGGARKKPVNEMPILIISYATKRRRTHKRSHKKRRMTVKKSKNTKRK